MAAWERARLGDLIETQKGFAFKSGWYCETGRPLVKVSDFTYDSVDSSNLVCIPETIAINYLRYELEIGDVVVQTVGSWPSNPASVVGKCVRIPNNAAGALLNQNAVKLSPVDVDRFDRKFLYYILRNDHFKTYIVGTAQGAASQAAITLEAIRGYEFNHPPLPTQRRIATILSTYDELIENIQRRIKILESMARSLYREWFVNFRFPGHETHPRVSSELGDIPQGWELKPFTEIANVLSGGTPKTAVTEYWNGEIPFFTPRDAPGCFYVQNTDKHITELGLSKCASELYPPDTIFITARGTVGKIALPSVPMAMNQSCYALRGKSGVPQRFLFLMTLQQVEYLKTNTGGATFDTIIVDTFRRMQVVKPPREIVTRFTCQIDGMFEQVNTLQRQIQNLRHTRDLLLPRLLSGQVNLEDN